MHSHSEVLRGNFDPLQLYQDLTQAFGKAPTLLLESADSHTKAGERSLIVAKSALRLTARGGRVDLEALSDFGHDLMEGIKRIYQDRLASSDLKKGTIVFDGPKGQIDLDEALKRPNVLDVLRDLLRLVDYPKEDAERFLLAGAFSYDLVDQFESLPQPKSDVLGFADYVFYVPEILIFIDHVAKSLEIVRHKARHKAFDNAELECIKSICNKPATLQNPDVSVALKFTGVLAEIEDDAFADLVSALKGHVEIGDVFQIVPSRTFRLPCQDALLSYRVLKAINPGPYMYYLADDDFVLFGSSPETFIKLDAKSRRVSLKPIAGTRLRGFSPSGKIDPELDARMEAELRLDHKELAEHMMLVDLARNDIARVCEIGTRRIDKLLEVERFSHVMHLVSKVSGTLRTDLDGLHAYQASLNMGTLVGAPKVKAAEILRQHEPSKRGPYGGAVGYIDALGNLDTAIIIRSAIVKNQLAHVRAGAGVVFDSDPVLEAEESRNKAMAVLNAINLVNVGLGEKK